MKVARLLVVVALTVAVLAAALRSRPEPIAWAPDLESALAEARADDRFVVLHVRDPARPLARRMDEEVLSDPEVARAARGFLHVRVDRSAPAPAVAEIGEGTALSTRVVDAEGGLVARLDGFADVERLTAFLGAVAASRERLAASFARNARAATMHDGERWCARIAALLDLGAVARAAEEAARCAQEVESAAAEGWDADARADATARLLCLRGRALLEQGRVAEARGSFARVVEGYPASRCASEAAAALATLAR